jgi:hypothetical protein
LAILSCEQRMLPVTLGYLTIVLRPPSSDELCAAVRGKQCLPFLKKSCDQAGVKLGTNRRRVR